MNFFNTSLSDELQSTERKLGVQTAANSKKYNSALKLFQEAEVEALDLAEQHEQHAVNIEDHIKKLRETQTNFTKEATRMRKFSSKIKEMFSSEELEA